MALTSLLTIRMSDSTTPSPSTVEGETVTTRNHEFLMLSDKRKVEKHRNGFRRKISPGSERGGRGRRGYINGLRCASSTQTCESARRCVACKTDFAILASCGEFNPARGDLCCCRA